MIELVLVAMLQTQQGPWDVFEAHNREPAGFHRGWDKDHDNGRGGNPHQVECDGNAQQCPGALRDCDADDPCATVPVDGGWAPGLMLGLGTAGVLWVTRRRPK